MKDKNIFDILENADNDSMDRLIDKCPELSDEELRKIYTDSERKFKMNEKKISGSERTKRDNIQITEGDVVEGVERVRRPSWIAPLGMAASLILVAGIAILSTVIISRKPVDEKPPVATISTETTVSTTSSEVTTTQPVTNGTYSEDISNFVGKWKYQISDNHTVSVDGRDMGIAEIFSDGTYTYTDNDGDTDTGIIEIGSEEIGGERITTLTFSNGNPEETVIFFVDETGNELRLGNGDSARLIRINFKDISKYSGKWEYQTAENGDFNNEPAVLQGTLEIMDNNTYTYTALDGTEKNGTVNIRTKERSDALWLDFIDSTSGERKTFFFNVDFQNMFFDGEGGRIVKVHDVDANIDVTSFAGQWLYQVSDGNDTVDVSPKNIGSLYINNDGYYRYTETSDYPAFSYNSYIGTIKFSTEEHPDGSSNILVEFWDNGTMRFSAYFNEDQTNILSIGNGGMERLIRGRWFGGCGIREVTGQWEYQELDSGYGVEKYKPIGSVTINDDETYSYTDFDGHVTTGKVETSIEVIDETELETVNFYEDGEFKFGGYYHFGNEEFISIGNGGLYRLIRK